MSDRARRRWTHCQIFEITPRCRVVAASSPSLPSNSTASEVRCPLPLAAAVHAARLIVKLMIEKKILEPRDDGPGL